MGNLVYIRNGKAWRVTVAGDNVTLKHGNDIIKFTNTGELKEQIKEELEKVGE